MTPSQAVLALYGLKTANVTPLSGGTINRVWRVDSEQGSYVLKQYAGIYDVAQVRQSVVVHQTAFAKGLPVPEVMANGNDDVVSEVDGAVYVLSAFVPGRLHEPSRIPAKAARFMGETLGRLDTALSTLAPGDEPTMPGLSAIEEHLRSLLAVARPRRGDPVDDIAVSVLEAKLELFATIEAIPEFTMQWTHGDYEWRNVLFGADDNVAGVIDFDNAIYYGVERDVMRCIALSFPDLEPEMDDFFAGYAAVRCLSRDDARHLVECYRYLSTFRVWPISERYLRPEHYQAQWDEFIQPFSP